MIKVGGKEVQARPATAREFFDLREKTDTDRAFNCGLLAVCTVDEAGNQVFTEEQIEDLTLPEWQRVERIVSQANSYEGDGEKN